jgi:hypothetical protein
MLLNLDSFSNLKGILVNVKRDYRPSSFFSCLPFVIILKDKLIIGKPYNIRKVMSGSLSRWIKVISIN